MQETVRIASVVSSTRPARHRLIRSALQDSAMLKLVVLALCLSIFSCANHVKLPDSYAYDTTKPLSPQFDSIRLNDGIDAREADILSTLYFLKHEGLCGANWPVTRRGPLWRAWTAVGPGGHPHPDITIDPKSGIVRQKGHPDSVPPWDDLCAFLRAYEQ